MKELSITMKMNDTELHMHLPQMNKRVSPKT